MTINQVAFCTTTSLALVTIGCSISAATAVSTIATVAYAILAALGAALSIAAMTGWAAAKNIEGAEDSAETYFQQFTGHIGYAIVGVGQFVAQTIFMSIVEGISRGISNLISNKMSGHRR